ANSHFSLVRVAARVRLRRRAGEERPGRQRRSPSRAWPIAGRMMLRNIGSHWALILMTIGATYLITPFTIGALGHEGYGTWALITPMTGYISLMALGVPMACVRYLAQDIAEGDSARVNKTIGSCAGLYLSIGTVAVVIGAVLMALFSAYDI